MTTRPNAGAQITWFIMPVLLLFVAGCGVRTKTVSNRAAKLYPPNNGIICLLAGAPPTDVKYEVLGRVMATKRTYGSSQELFPKMAIEGRKLGADAIINLQASQKFKGPLPWRVTSPTGDGTAIKITADSPQMDCGHAGGKSF